MMDDWIVTGSLGVSSRVVCPMPSDYGLHIVILLSPPAYRVRNLLPGLRRIFYYLSSPYYGLGNGGNSSNSESPWKRILIGYARAISGSFDYKTRVGPLETPDVLLNFLAPKHMREGGIRGRLSFSGK